MVCTLLNWTALHSNACLHIASADTTVHTTITHTFLLHFSCFYLLVSYPFFFFSFLFLFFSFILIFPPPLSLFKLSSFCFFPKICKNHIIKGDHVIVAISEDSVNVLEEHSSAIELVVEAAKKENKMYNRISSLTDSKGE